jgi:hypothetical protein
VSYTPFPVATASQKLVRQQIRTRATHTSPDNKLSAFAGIPYPAVIAEVLSVINGPDFQVNVFDFVGRWRPQYDIRVREAIALHPTAAAWRRDPYRMARDYHNLFQAGGPYGHYTMEHVDRLQAAILALQHWRATVWLPRLRRSWRLVFVFYPAMRLLVRRWLEVHYSPGGRGYLAAKARFDALKPAALPL